MIRYLLSFTLIIKWVHEIRKCDAKCRHCPRNQEKILKSTKMRLICKEDARKYDLNK